MTRREQVCALAVGALLGYLYWINREDTATVTVDPRSLPDKRFDPFIHWRTDAPSDYYAPYPLSVGQNIIPLIYQSQDSGRALEVTCPDGDSYPQ